MTNSFWGTVRLHTPTHSHVHTQGILFLRKWSFPYLGTLPHSQTHTLTPHTHMHTLQFSSMLTTTHTFPYHSFLSMLIPTHSHSYARTSPTHTKASCLRCAHSHTHPHTHTLIQSHTPIPIHQHTASIRACSPLLASSP